MSVVVVADGVLAIEDRLKASSVEELFIEHKIDRDLAEDSVVEEACRLKEKMAGSSLTLVTTAPAAFEKAMRSYIAAGCDRAIRVDCDHETLFDVKLRALIIADVLAGIEGWRVVMLLDRTGGGAPSLLPHYVAAQLRIPSVSSVVRAEAGADEIKIITRRAGMIRQYRSRSPVVLAVTSRVALRNLGFKDVHRARKAEIKVVESGSLPHYAEVTAGGHRTGFPGVHAPASRAHSTDVNIEALSTEEAVNRILALYEPYLAD
ncbi:MAG: hypothetical protein OXN26_03105 [Gammaproteobacteria bacterium]|nr:hypothetical protein [Gammaproteobacteria bacterium]